jgi:hypothetical protein
MQKDKKTGQESFSNNCSLLSFWQWAHSDIMNNAERGRIAEYIVAMALGLTDTPRTEWDACDLITPDGIRIEVKSSAYLQTWHQSGFSRISFDIAPKRFWDAQTHLYSEEYQRHSDIYVFCLCTCKEPEQANPLDLTQWKFYVVPTAFLNCKLGTQKTLSLGALQKFSFSPISFYEIKEHVCSCDVSSHMDISPVT